MTINELLKELRVLRNEHGVDVEVEVGFPDQDELSGADYNFTVTGAWFHEGGRVYLDLKGSP